LPILFPIFFPNLDQSLAVWPPHFFTNLFYRQKTARVNSQSETPKKKWCENEK